MQSLMSALAFASAFTAIFAFRFRMKPWALGLYFVGLAAVEWTAQSLLLPPDALPVEVYFVLFGIAALFTVLSVLQRRFLPE